MFISTTTVSSNQDFMKQVASQYTKTSENNKEEKNQVTQTETGVSIDISSEAKELYNKNRKTTTQLLEEMKAEKEAAEAQADSVKELMKIFEIARRIANGDKVPPSDEKKLMEFNSDLYLASKSAAPLNANKKHKEYDSIFEDKEKESEQIESESENDGDLSASNEGGESTEVEVGEE